MEESRPDDAIRNATPCSLFFLSRNSQSHFILQFIASIPDVLDFDIISTVITVMTTIYSVGFSYLANRDKLPDQLLSCI